jgi:sensor c-di-GMP phosphodiesterase-like protein
MSGLETVWSYTALEEALGFGISVLTVLMIASLAVWFACSIVERVLETNNIRHLNHDALLRENERLRTSLAEAQEKNDYLRKLYCELPPRVQYEGRRAA